MVNISLIIVYLIFIHQVLTSFQYDHKQLIQLNIIQIYMIIEEIIQLIKLIKKPFSSKCIPSQMNK